MKQVPAEFRKSAFNCPHSNCGAYAKQAWETPNWWRQQLNSQGVNPLVAIPHLMTALCDHCGQVSLWVDGKLVYPFAQIAPAPHPDTPDAIKADYEEARSVFQQSPRSSAALLRLCIQKICIELGLSGKNLNDDIGTLVKQGLAIRIQQSLDIVRVIGNNQVHPGVLDVRDDPEMATVLFDLVNIIVEDRLARPKQIEALYGKLPEGARKQIEERDKAQQA
jgi:hypothetical protein